MNNRAIINRDNGNITSINTIHDGPFWSAHGWSEGGGGGAKKLKSPPP